MGRLVLRNIKTILILAAVLFCFGSVTYFYRTADDVRSPRLADPRPQSTTSQLQAKALPPPLPPRHKRQDLCQDVQKIQNRNASMSWLYWACQIEKEVEKPYPYKCKEQKIIKNWRICLDKPYTPRKPCIVYSFGIGFDFNFDDEMAKLGCEVYSFDPSMGVNDHNHSSSVQFRNMGVGSRDTDTFNPYFDAYVKKKQTWKMRTLKSIKKMLGHENAVIDVLKIDIESYEWAVVENFFQDEIFKSVRQFLVEWHVFHNRPRKTSTESMYNTLTRLEQMGLKFFYFFPCCRRHILSRWLSQADVFYVNTKFTKPSP